VTNWVELIGYLASLLIALSMMMNNIWRLRWINLIGAVVFSIYGIIVKAYPVFAVNAFITVVDIYYIVQMATKSNEFELLSVDVKSSQMLHKFLEFYREDIQKYMPKFDLESLKNPHAIFILRDMVPVGLFIYEKQDNTTIKIQLDYVIPSYRDLKNAHFLYSVKLSQFAEQGFETIVAESNVKDHQNYLKQLGFSQDNENPSLLRKAIGR